MEHDNNGDEMIEIIPDIVPEEDHDIKISDPQKGPDEDHDIKIADPAKETSGDGEAGIVTALTGFSEDDFSEELEEVDREQQDLEILEEIGDSIINQVETESWEEFENEREAGDGSDDRGSREDGEDTKEGPDGGNEDDEPGVRGFFARFPKWGYVVIGCSFAVIIFLLWLTMSASGQQLLIRFGSRYIADKMNYQPVGPVEGIEYIEDPEDNEVSGIVSDMPDNYAVITPETPEITEPPEEEQKVFNILLIGEENIDSESSRGRSDLLIIATLNLEQNTVKLTSVLRDSLVSIPNHLDNRINAAYMMGGVSLLYDTFRTNLSIEFDNYCLVNFESFEKIVNSIGGVDISLTAEEAEYLNSTNYISVPEYRTVKEGMNHMNGNQALGYCRVRKVPTADLQYGDIGRTARQRKLMRGVVERVGKMSNMEFMKFVDDCMTYVTTDMTSEDIEKFMLILTSMMPLHLEEFRLPVEGSYSDVRLRGMLVTQIDLKTNTEALHRFIYGK